MWSAQGQQDVDESALGWPRHEAPFDISLSPVPSNPPPLLHLVFGQQASRPTGSAAAANVASHSASHAASGGQLPAAQTTRPPPRPGACGGDPSQRSEARPASTQQDGEPPPPAETLCMFKCGRTRRAGHRSCCKACRGPTGPHVHPCEESSSSSDSDHSDEDDEDPPPGGGPPTPPPPPPTPPPGGGARHHRLRLRQSGARGGLPQATLGTRRRIRSPLMRFPSPLRAGQASSSA